jgi:hypothetical protein
MNTEQLKNASVTLQKQANNLLSAAPAIEKTAAGQGIAGLLSRMFGAYAKTTPTVIPAARSYIAKPLLRSMRRAPLLSLGAIYPAIDAVRTAANPGDVAQQAQNTWWKGWADGNGVLPSITPIAKGFLQRPVATTLALLYGRNLPAELKYKPTGRPTVGPDGKITFSGAEVIPSEAMRAGRKGLDSAIGEHNRIMETQGLPGMSRLPESHDLMQRRIESMQQRNHELQNRLDEMERHPSPMGPSSSRITPVSHSADLSNRDIFERLNSV